MKLVVLFFVVCGFVQPCSAMKVSGLLKKDTGAQAAKKPQRVQQEPLSTIVRPNQQQWQRDVLAPAVGKKPHRAQEPSSVRSCVGSSARDANHQQAKEYYGRALLQRRVVGAQHISKKISGKQQLTQELPAVQTEQVVIVHEEPQPVEEHRAPTVPSAQPQSAAEGTQSSPRRSLVVMLPSPSSTPRTLKTRVVTPIPPYEIPLLQDDADAEYSTASEETEDTQEPTDYGMPAVQERLDTVEVKLRDIVQSLEGVRADGQVQSLVQLGLLKIMTMQELAEEVGEIFWEIREGGGE